MAPPEQLSAQASPTSALKKNSATSESQAGDVDRPTSKNGQPVATVMTRNEDQQRIVLPDPVAFRYLEDDPTTVVLSRSTTLQGYETYIVEQWACSRAHPTFIIATYTGDPSHTIQVGVLAVPMDRNLWSPRVKLYFTAVQQCLASPRETPLGTLMVTNLSALHSALTVISVPNGDVKGHRDTFVVNENLKRLGCAGRAGLNLHPPSPVVEAKFYQLYRTSERVPLYSAVVELVKQCQTALTIFDKLAPEYVDGLLCDVTEKAIVDWWADIGTDLYNVEPNDGTLGPMTVAALLGTFMGARNRLHAYGAPVPKDVFDTRALKAGIGSFQKSQKLKKTRRLDRQTLDRLHRVTAKAAASTSESWTGAVKHTVAELSGKGGEMVMGMVGRDKVGIGDVETLDLERFVQLVTGERARWLWHGKPRKTHNRHGSELAPEMDDLVFGNDDQGGYVWTSRRRRGGSESPATHEGESNLSSDDREQNLGKIVSRSLTGKVSDARAGFGRFKDAVGISGRRSHHAYKFSKDTGAFPENEYIHGNGVESESDGAVFHTHGELPGKKQPKSPPRDNQGEGSNVASPITKPIPEIHIEAEPTPDESKVDISRLNSQDLSTQATEDGGEITDLELSKTRSTDGPTEQSQEPSPGSPSRSLRRSQSVPVSCPNERLSRNARWPRHLSFSIAEEVVLGWEGFRNDVLGQESDLERAMRLEDVLFSDAQIFRSRIQDLSQKTIPWVEEQVDSVGRLLQQASSLHEELNAMYPERSEEFQGLRERIAQFLGDETTRLTESIKRLELLGAKLDYELNVLQSKVDEVEDGLREFERQVVEIEARIKGLVNGERQQHGSSLLSWISRIFGRA
ncbi:hypothetical protein VTN49DRAFT_4662 [Thermomyces lanuginosus]|uniref:uncharacterized protein n=1 Tax=Thermomyces lanuginosus TaxID=5541 RepID=UPI0037438E0E